MNTIEGIFSIHNLIVVGGAGGAAALLAGDVSAEGIAGDMLMYGGAALIGSEVVSISGLSKIVSDKYQGIARSAGAGAVGVGVLMLAGVLPRDASTQNLVAFGIMGGANYLACMYTNGTY